MRWHRPYLLGGKVGAKKGTFFVNHKRMKSATFFVPPPDDREESNNHDNDKADTIVM